MKRFFLLSWLIFVIIAGSTSVSPAQSPAVGEKYVYRVSWQDQLVGYSKFYVAKRMELAGEVFYNLESVSEMKIGMGEVEHMTFSSQMTVSHGSFLPNFFKSVQKIGNVEMGVECLISTNLIAQRNTSPAGHDDIIVSLDQGQPAYIFMNNLWGRVDTLMEHYWLLLKSGKTGKIYAYDPVLQHKGFITLEKGDVEEVEVSGKKIRARKYVLYDLTTTPAFTFWADSASRIVKLQESGGMTFELTGKDVAAQLKAAPGVDLWKNRVCRSDTYIPDADKVSWMKIEMSFRGRGIEAKSMNMPGFSQVFEGEAADGKTTGVFTVETSPAQVSNPAPFPVTRDWPEETLPYLKEEMGIEINDELLKNRSMEAAWKAPTVWEAARKINQWIFRNVPNGIALPSAKMTMANEQGNSESKALLGIAMCRSMGIPARRAGGVVFSGGSFIPHYWFEVYTGEPGWVPLDPSSGEAENMGATHVRLFSMGDIWDIEGRVIDFRPKPPERVTFINREITWPVGESRVYNVKRRGQVIGQETAKVEEVVVLEDTETYRMSMESRLGPKDSEAVATGRFWVDPQGLPFRFQKETTMGARKETQSFQASGPFLIQNIERDGKQQEMKIPFSKGAYLADTSFLSQWALILGQLGDLSIGRAYTFTIFIPETTSFETINANVRKFESVEAGDKIYEAFQLETGSGIQFWLEKSTGRLVKLSFPTQEVDLELTSSEFKI
jgi:hypothetical protein